MASLDTIRIISIGIIFNLAIFMGFGAIGITQANGYMDDFFNDLVAAQYTGNENSGVYSAQEQMQNIRDGGITPNGEEVEGLGWIANTVNSISAQISNIGEGLINIAKFITLIFTLLAGSMFTFALIGGLQTGGNLVLSGIAYMFALLSTIINFIYIREIFLIIVSRKTQ